MSTAMLPRRQREFVEKSWRYVWTFDATGVTVSRWSNGPGSTLIEIAREKGL